MDGQLSWYVLERSPDERWVLAWGENKPGGTCRLEEPHVAPREWSVMGAALELHDSYATWVSVHHLALRDGWPALVSFWRESHSNTHESVERQEWDGLQGTRWTAERKLDGGDGTRSVSTEFALLPVLAQEAPLPPTLNRIPVGRKHHAGAVDASLRVSVLEVVLPLSLLGYAATRPIEGREVPFTAVFSDSDEDGGQQTLIATSDLQWGVPASFGSLVFTAGGRRHPAPAPRHGIESWRRLEGKARLRGE